MTRLEELVNEIRNNQVKRNKILDTVDKTLDFEKDEGIYDTRPELEKNWDNSLKEDREMVYKTALKHLADPFSADDATQVIMERHLDGRVKVLNPQNVKAILIQDGIKGDRKKKGITIISTETLLEQGRDISTTDSLLEEKLLTNDQLIAAINSLDGLGRRVIIGSYFDKFTYEELSVIENTSKRTIRRRIKSAKNNLKTYILKIIEIF